MPLAALPSELYSCILSHVPPSGRQAATLNLSRAIPLSPVPLHSLFEHIIISRNQQVAQLYRRLFYPTAPALIESGTSKERAWIKSLAFRTFQVDADVVVNILALLPGIEHLSLLIGTIFAPEHLEDIFRREALALCLNTLSLRFKPYVQKATYYQFLKGSYFDGTLELLSRWPSNPCLTRLSIIQDPLIHPPVEQQTKPFAQPMVFFSLSPLTTLSISPAMQNITHLRLRIPSRQLVRFIAISKVHAAERSSHFPSLVYIDISTSAVRDSSEVEALMMYTGSGRLKHMVLDETGLCNGSEGEWESLGRSCALAGVRRMREREKAFKAWIEAESVSSFHNQDVADPMEPLPNAAQERRPRRGRRGLATATISLRNSSPQDPSTSAAVRPGMQSGRPSRTGRMRVLPPPPYLSSLSTSLPRLLGQPNTVGIQAREAKARSDFAKGWLEGLTQLHAIWARLRQSQSNGVRVLRFSSGDTGTLSTLGDFPEMLKGLVDMGKPSDDEYWEELQKVEPPVLCFAGSQEREVPEREVEYQWPDHPDGCGHRTAWNV